MRHFASDNTASVHPKVLDAMSRANIGHAPAYGYDELTQRVERKLCDLFGARAAFLVFNGTGANVLGLDATLRRHEAVLCAASAHIATDEGGAPERFIGSKLVTIPTPDGKLTPALIEPHLVGIGDEHRAQPRVVSITQASELGTAYKPDEVRMLARFCRDHGLLLHMDGARLANAVASLGVPAHEMVQGVDVLSFGGTKNGAMLAEAVVFLRDDLLRDFRHARKQGMQLASKMRYVAAQMDALLTDGLWLDNARHANRMAKLLAERAAKHVQIAYPVEANEVFAILQREKIAALQKERLFYVWEERSSLVRWVCSWDTTEEDVLSFVDAVQRVLAG